MDEDKENVDVASPMRNTTALQNTPTDLSKMDQMKFMSLMTKAKNLTNSGHVQEALTLYKNAQKICRSEKLQMRIDKMEAFLAGKHSSNVTSSASDNGSEVKSKHQSDGSMEMSTPKIKHQNRDTVSLSSQSTPAVELDEENKAVYLSLVSEAKRLIKEDQISDALDMYKKAAEIHPGEKLLRKISRMEEYLKENNADISQQTVKDDKKKSETNMTEEDLQTFNKLVKKAKQCASEGNIHHALELNKEALHIYNSEKLQHRIAKLEEYLKQNEKTEPTGNENTHVKKDSDSAQQTSSNELDVDEQRVFNELVIKAKQLAQEGDVKEAVEMNKKALKIFYSDKLQKRIKKMEEYLASCDGEESSDGEDGGMINIGQGFHLYKDLSSKLFAHQREGVLWMWGLHQKKKGGILGDDMGLGKTIQVIAFLSGLFDMDRVNSVLIVMPVSVIVNWEKEFAKWAPGIRVYPYHGTKKEKERSLLKVQKRGGVLLTSYGLVVTSYDKLGQREDREFKWDYLILDEGHKIKNPTKTTKGVHQIGAKNRIILTGTPIQNNLRELWSLFDFVHQGSLLGTARTFKMEFDNPITRARERDATAGERKLGQEMAESLKKIIAPFFLRRTKAEVTEKGIKKEQENPDQAAEEKHLTKMPSMTRKNDFIVWMFLTETQQRIYSDFLSLDHVKELLMTKKSPLVALTVLKKICDHPRLLSRRGCAQLGLDGNHRLDDLDLESEEGLECAANQIKDVSDHILISESGKVIFVVELLDKMKEEGHRCLVFSQSRKMLDIIEQVIRNRGHKVMRLDGTVTQLSERDERIGRFQRDASYSVFLLTTQVGGVGLTLTAADRVIIFDPSWNPATDAQAVDRVFRIGQDKNVVIYRLITCGTVEEKIYRRQVFKDSINRQTTGNSKNPYRYFTKQELRELFSLDNPRHSKTQVQLEEMHSGHRKTDSKLDAHVAFLYSLDIFGLSDHDLMFTQEKCDIDYTDDDDSGRKAMDNEDDYIQHRVQKAQELIRMESDLSQNFSERSGGHQRNVDSGQSSRPFAQPWQNWNFQGNVKSDDAYNEDIKPKTEIKLEPDMTVKTEPVDDVVDLTSMDDRVDVDLTTPPSSPCRQSPPSSPCRQSPPSSPSRESPPSSSSKQDMTFPTSSECAHLLVKREAEDSEDNLPEDFGHMSITESPENSPVKVKSEKITPMKAEKVTPVKTEKVTPPKMESSFTESTFSSPMHVNSSSMDFEEESRFSSLQNDVVAAVDKEIEDDVFTVTNDSANITPTKHASMIPKSTDMTETDPVESTDSTRLNDSHSSMIKTPSKRTKRRSVSQSPWLKHTPKPGSKHVIQEEILISPDGGRPMIGTRPRNIMATESPSKPSQLNSTILSAFSDSPSMTKDIKKSKPNQSILGMTLIENSPDEGHKHGSLFTTIIEDSPNGSRSDYQSSPLSFNKSTNIVIDSVQNTPAITSDSIVHKVEDSDVILESEEEMTPKRPKVKHRKSLESSFSPDSEEVENVHNFRGSSPSVAEKIDESPEDMPKLALRRQNRRVIDSDQSDSSSQERRENDSVSDDDDEMEQQGGERRNMSVIEVVDSGDSDTDSYEMDVSTRKLNEDLIDESLQEKFPKKHLVMDEEDEEENEDTDMSGFIVNDSEEEDESDEKMTDEEEEMSDDEERNSGFSGLPLDMQTEYKELVRNSRRLYKEGLYTEALAHVLQALEIFPEDSMQALALKIHQKMMS